jgi:hypothetical protein
MADSQAEAVRDLLVERLELFDASLDTSDGSPLWTQVIEPVFDRLGTDPFDTDIRSFLKDRVSQEFPELSAQEGDLLVDLLITPHEVLMEPLKREIQIIRDGQSANNADIMRLEDAQALAANFFTTWRSGSRASGLVRIYYSSPTYVNVLATTVFKTSDGLRYVPTTPVLIRPETMLLQRSGTEYYVEIPVIAESTGSQYNTAQGTITAVEGLTGFTRITNLQSAEGGADAETTQELLDRTKSSLTERSLNVRRGIVARLLQDFPTLVDVEAVGFGDPEMQRDIVTGGGEGSVVASGFCIIVGQFCLMFSMFEDRGQKGLDQIAVGDEIELNFWKFLYDVDATAANESFLIEQILFDSRNAITEMPSVILFQMDGAPSIASPVAGTLPGVLPGVFAVVRSAGKIEISDIPGGILNPDTARGTIEVVDGEVHIGGHYDVWLRPSSNSTATADFTDMRSEAAHLEGADLVTNGDSSTFRHLVHREYKLTVSLSSGALQLGEMVMGGTSGATGVIAAIASTGGTGRILTMWELDGTPFEATETIIGSTSGGTAVVGSISSYDWDTEGAVEAGMVLSVVQGSEAGTYRVTKVDGPFMYLDSELTTTALGNIFRVITEVSIDAFDPKSILVPFGDAQGDDLRTTIGSKLLRTTTDLSSYGVVAGDTIEILEGDDKGTYVISGFDSTYGGTGPLVSVAMSGTDSGLTYRVYRASSPLQRPLIRIQPGGVTLLDPGGQDSGYTVPYALPVDGRAAGAFSGSKAIAAGLNGFVVMDPGPTWAPTADYLVDIDGTDYLAESGYDFDTFYEDGNFQRVYTDSDLDCEGYLAVISIYDDGAMLLDSNLPANVQTFLQDMRSWFTNLITSFGFGGDEQELIDGFSPIEFGPNTDGSRTLVHQFEICLPYALFDGCNNVFVALPEFDWESEFAEEETFQDAIGRYNDGTMVGRAPALLQSRPGDVLTVLSGGNAGSYVIDQVHKYYLVAAGQVVAGDIDLENDAYQVGLVVIRDVFPVEPLYGLTEFFEGSTPTWSLPTSPALPFTVTDSGGGIVDGWTWVETALTWFFQWMDSLGFDLPESVELDVPETLRAFWQMLFSPYVVSRPTADQYTRLHFIEPTSCTVYAPMPCERYTWGAPVHSAVAISGADFTLPLVDLEGMTISMRIQRIEGLVTLSGTLTSAAGSAATAEDLAAAIQAVLDPAADYVTFSGPATATGALTITPVVGGVDEIVYLDANDHTDAFFVLGFRETEPGVWPEITSTGPTVGVPYETITTATGHAVGIGITVLTTDLVHLTGTAAASVLGFTIGETVEGQTSLATGTLWAVANDEDGVQSPHFWLTDVVGTFQAETIVGQSSSDSHVITVVDSSPTITDLNVSDNDLAIDKTFEEVATDLEAALTLGLQVIIRGGVTSGAYEDERWSATFTVSVEWVNNGDGSGQFEFTIYDSVYTSAVQSWQLDDATNAIYDDPLFVDTYVGVTTALPMSSTAGVVTGDDYTPTTTQPTIDVDYDSAAVGDVAFAHDYWEAAAFETAVLDEIDASDWEAAAQALNASADYYADTTSGERVVLWYSTGSALALRALTGGSLGEMTSTDLATLGFSDTTTTGADSSTNAITQGTTVVGASNTVFHEPHQPTLFVAAAGAAELLFTPSSEAEAYQVFPGQDEDGDIPATELPRDVMVAAEYSGQLSAELAFSDDSYASPLDLGFTPGSDWLWVYEQLTFLEHTIIETDAQISRDRVPAVKTEFGSAVVTLLEQETDEFTFLNPSVSIDDLPANKVEVGDLFFLEEGEDAGGYVVVARDDHTLTLDRALTESTGRIYRWGNDGVIEPDPATATFQSAAAAFTDDDVGRYVTIYAANRDDFDGSYQITAVASDGGSCTLDTPVWDETEQDIHWAVVKAPIEDPSSSATGGRTELVGLRPFRAYRGTPTTWRIADVSPHTSRSLARVHVSLGGSTDGPKAGYRQPYKIVRPGAQRISSTTMSGQSDCGFYYFDVLAHSLGGDEVYNVPKDVRMEPVFGTYDSDGYRMEVVDNRLAFSTSEDASIVFTPTFLPVGFDDRPESLLKLEGRSFRIAYDYSPIVAQAQRLMTSETDRVLCANVLARHFLPSYVSFCVTYRGGNRASVLADALIDYIDGLPALEELDISKLEKVLHSNSAESYSHPVYVWTVTHDLDRRLVGARSDDRLSDDDIPYNGTNRTTFFIAGADYSATEDETDIPYGERIYLTRQIPTPTFR